MQVMIDDHSPVE